MSKVIPSSVMDKIQKVWESNPEMLAWILKLTDAEQFTTQGDILVGGVHFVVDSTGDGHVETLSAAAICEEIEPAVGALLALNALTSQLQHMASQTIPAIIGKEINAVTKQEGAPESSEKFPKKRKKGNQFLC